jgi:anti-sigma-K factor RskA
MGRSTEFSVTCDERRDSIFLYAADQLEPAEMEELRVHLAGGCPSCEGALAEAHATLAQMTLAMDPVEPSEQTRNALMARIGVSNLESDITESKSQTRQQMSRMRIFSTAFLSAAAAVAITSAVFVYATRTERTFFRSSNLQAVAMTSQTQPRARGQVLWDKDHSQWHVAVFDLAPPPTGKEYQLWFISPNKGPIPSRTFTVDENGHQSLVVQIPGDIGPIAAAAVTLENAGGTDKPTMPIQLVGNVPG